jgi:deoxyadenosine/deoxycytidine kinase
MPDSPDPASKSPSPRVVVVGPCASGKSTLVNSLQEFGIEAWVAGQEHSVIRKLWDRRKPDVVVALDLSLDTLRERRGESWSADLFKVQHERLQDAFERADLVIDTGETPVEDVLSQVLDLLGRVAAKPAN